MSRGESFSRFNAGACSFLEADVGPVDEEDCAVGPCGDDAVYRVPWPQFGGDVAYCPYHLTRYRSSYREEFKRVQEHVDDDLSAFATRGDRFLTLDDVPTRIRGGRYRRVGLTELGYGLYEETNPDSNGLVTYVLVNRHLGYTDALRVPSERAGEFLDEFNTERGIHEWDPEARDALFGTGGDRR